MLRHTIELGVDHIDTSQYYAPDVVNDLSPKRCIHIRRISSGSTSCELSHQSHLHPVRSTHLAH